MSIDFTPTPNPIVNIVQCENSIGERPDWLLDSPYFFIDEEGGWALKEDAPDELKKKFKEYMDESD